MVRSIISILFILIFMNLTYAQKQKELSIDIIYLTETTVNLVFKNHDLKEISFKPTLKVDGVLYSRDNQSIVKIAPFSFQGVTFNIANGSKPNASSVFKALIEVKCMGESIQCDSYEIKGTYIPSSSSLPVTLTKFNVESRGMYNYLTWQTASEQDSKSFEIQRSIDGKTFISVANIDAAGNSSTIRNYSFNDYYTEPEYTYYRLKQIDIDGTYEYSKTMVSYNRPDATKNFLGFSIHRNEKPATVIVFDTNGKLIKDIYITNNEPVVNLDRGSYVVVLITDKSRYSRKLIQQ
jgi:hypothetical protein